MIFPDEVVMWLAVAGVCFFILGAHRVGLALVSPAVIRFAICPSLAPALDQVSMTPLFLLAPIILVFGAISILQSVVRLFYGRVASGHVAATYLIRVFDFIGRRILAIFRLPFRNRRRLP